MPETVVDLGKKVKAKYPGQYDDLGDAEVGARVKAKFPGAYDDFADVSASPAGTLAYKQETARQQFEANKPVPTAGTQMAAIRDKLLAIPGGMADLFKAGLSGNVSALANGIAGIPASIVMPPVQYAQAIANKDPEAAANAATDIVTNTLPAVYGGVKAAQAVPSAIRNISALKPAEQAAVEFAAKNDIPIRPSTATGNKVLAGTETATKHLPLFAGRGEALKQATDAALTGKAGELANTTAGASSKEIAGSNVVSSLQSKVEWLNNLANAAYDQARTAAAANVKDVQTGTQLRSVLENGGVVQKEVPVIESIQSPVDLSSVKKGLAPLLTELEAQIPEAQRQMSPGLAALRNVMNSADTVPLSKAMDDLSAIQNIARTDLPQLRSRAQGIAAAVTKPLRAAVDTAAGEAGALDALNAGRELTRQKYQVGDLLSAVKDKEPVRIIDALTSQRDRSIQTLRDIATAAPDSVKDIAGSTLSSIFDRATNEGTFRGAKAAADWAKLGDETKKLLFTPDHIKDLDNFFNLARMEAKDFNPSGTAKVGALTAAGGLAIYNPIAAGASVIGADVLSRLLYKPNWAKLVVGAMKTPASSSAAKIIAPALISAAGQSSQMPRAQ